NFKMVDDGGSIWSKHKKYDGPWRPYVRDIDPSIIIKTTRKENSLENLEVLPWWIPSKYQNWQESPGSWKRRSDDFPPIMELLTIKDSNNVEWLNLNMHPSWKEPKKLGEERWG